MTGFVEWDGSHINSIDIVYKTSILLRQTLSTYFQIIKSCVKTRHAAERTFAVLLSGIFGTSLRGRGVLPEDKKSSPLSSCVKTHSTQNVQQQIVKTKTHSTDCT